MISQLKAAVFAVFAFLLMAFGLASQAQAALPEGITTAITGATGDLATAATAIIVGMLAFWGLRKLGSKMGWW